MEVTFLCGENLSKNAIKDFNNLNYSSNNVKLALEKLQTLEELIKDGKIKVNKGNDKEKIIEEINKYSFEYDFEDFDEIVTEEVVPLKTVINIIKKGGLNVKTKS